MMPAYNFKKEFAPMILSGRKPHTIRRIRKRPTVAGDVLYLYTGMRTKACEKIAETTCTKVVSICIYPISHFLACGFTGMFFSDNDVIDIAIADGFSGVDVFFKFFYDTYKMYRLNDFEIVYWDVEKVKSANKN